MKKILVLNGPNLNLLGEREPAVYGRTTLAQIEAELQDRAQQAGVMLTAFQSNLEGELINQIHQAKRSGTDFILINPAALTHTSVALRDAFLATSIPFIEVHLSNVHAREPFRKHSYLSDIALGVITGFAANSYYLGLEAALTQMSGQTG